MKKLTLFVIGLFVSLFSFAGEVTEAEALQKAQQFFKDKRIESKHLRRAAKAGQQQTTTQDYYVFNAENKGGFVIISGDDRTPEVLGYADRGSFDMDNLPPNLKEWLEGYSKQIESLETSENITNRASSRAPKAAIEPLITTQWGQDYPYNMKCPDWFGSGDKCVTGCIATAMAQVMYYHRAKSVNKTIAEIPGYKCGYIQGEGQITISAIPEGSIIDWDNMLDSYGGTETDIKKEAVANLMLYCGAAVKMNYAPGYSLSGGSSAIDIDIPYALRNYFDYSEHTKLVWHHDYTEESWEELIYSELRKGNPILYTGYNSSAGHAFVCDGYDGNGYYHINWGWNGLSDSYFLLSALTPEMQGTGGSSEGYNNGQCALVGAVPNGEIMRLTSQSVSLTGNSTFTLSEVGDNITVPVRWIVKNQTDTSCSFDHAIGLYRNDEFVKVLDETGTSVPFAIDEEVTVDASPIIEANLAAGVYQLYALCRTHGDDKWFRNEKSSDCFITLVVKDGSMNLYIGKPSVAENVINFADDEVKRICVENWDTDGDGEISFEEAAAVTDFGYVFDRSFIKTFDEAQYFTGITSFGLNYIEGFGCTSLVSIKLPSSVTSIRDGAFYGCQALASIDVPASVKEIGRKAFQACFSLQEIVLHEGLETIKDDAIYKCSSLSSFSIPASVTSLGNQLFFECANLNDFYVDDNNQNYCAIDGVLFSKDRKKLMFFPVKREGTYNIPDGTEDVNSYAFITSRLENINIPSSVISLGDFAFSDMFNLKEITIPSTVTTIGNGLLNFCYNNLKSVVLEGSRTIIPEGMFANCASLKNINLPDGIVSIGVNTFIGCSSLTEITIPSSVTSIGDNAFSNSGLIKVTSLMQNPCAITSTVFENINSYAILYVPEESLTRYKEADNWKKFTQILSIGENGTEAYAELLNGVLSFYYDTNREERNGITYDYNNPNSWLENRNAIIKVFFDVSYANVRPISTEGWFYGCDKLAEIQGIENLNTSEVTSMMTMFSNCSSLTSIDISSFNTDKVTSMLGMFWDCSNLKKVVLPDDLKFIDSHQFHYCSSLEEISLPESVTSIHDYAFAGCSSLTEVTIPSKVTFIGDNAFSNSGLTKVMSLMQTPCTIVSSVFENVYSNATLYVPKGSVSKYQEAGWNMFTRITDKLPYKLTYYVDGEIYKSYEIEYGSSISPEPAPTKEGYTFSGWSEIPETMPAHDVTVTGTFSVNKYKLIYMVDGEEYKTSEVEYGTAITAEAEPTKEGYTFSGWSEIPETMPAHDVTVTGTFTINKYKLTYEVDGEEYKTFEVEYGTVITAEAEPTKEGYTFSGWSEIPETMPAHDVTVTGTFTINKYTITYMIDDEVYQTESVDYGSMITPPSAPEREGYTFEWMDVPETMPAHDITIVGSYTSGINAIRKESENGKVYDLNGRQVKTPRKGVYIINSKKVVVK